MISINCYDKTKAEEWNQFVNSSRAPMFMFNRGFMEYHKDRFCDASLMVYDDDKLVAILPASQHGSEVRTHGGLTYGGILYGEKMKQQTMLDCFSAIIQYYKDQGITSIIYKSIPYIYNTYPTQEDLYALFRHGAQLLKTEPSSTLLLASPFKMTKGRKAQISRARREGVVITESKDFQAFITLENEVLSQHHNVKAVHTADELQLLHNRFPENIRCYMAKNSKGHLIAAALLFIYPHVIHTQYLASNDEGRTIGALDLLISEIMQKYKETHTYLDFGISTEDMGKKLNNGLISQKESFGARTCVYQTWTINID